MKLMTQVFAFIFSLLYCIIPSSFSSTANAAVESEPLPTVYATEVHLTEIFDTFSYPARVIPKVNTTILSEIDGVVSRILTPLGRSVESGQKLIILSHTDPVYQYEPVSVISPVKGIISSVEVTEGSQITKGQKLVSVTNPSDVTITLEIPAQDLDSIKAGALGQFRLSTEKTPVEVKVRGVSPFVDPSTGTATAELELFSKSNKQNSLRPGLVGQVVFRSNVHSGISIPDQAIFYKGNKTFVRLIQGNKAKQIPVELGRKQGGLVEITKGLKPNTLIVERSSRFIADGESIQIEKSEANQEIKDNRIE